LLAFGILGLIVAGVSGLSSGWAVAIAGLLIAGNYLFVHFGLSRIADAVAAEAPAVRAA
jgi:hypothetical protein